MPTTRNRWATDASRPAENHPWSHFESPCVQRLAGVLWNPAQIIVDSCGFKLWKLRHEAFATDFPSDNSGARQIAYQFRIIQVPSRNATWHCLLGHAEWHFGFAVHKLKHNFRKRIFVVDCFVFIFGLPVKPSGCVRVFSDQMGLSACQYVHVPGDLTVELNFP